MMTRAISLAATDMGKVSYPFAALPNQVCRGGHGAINVAVLAVLLSHGRTSASAQTLANEIGCDRKSVFKSFKYWQVEGPRHGIHLRTGERKGCTTVIEIDILICHQESTASTENGTGAENSQYRKGNTAVPNTERAPVPKTAHKEEPFRRPLKKNLPLPPQGGEGKIFVPGRGPRRAKPYIEGDLARYDEERGVWRVRIYTGEWVDYGGDAKKHLVWK